VGGGGVSGRPGLAAPPLRRRTPRQLALTGGQALLLVSVAFFSMTNSRSAWPLILRHYHEMTQIADATRRGDERPMSTLPNFTPEQAGPWRLFLQEHHLSLFRAGPPSAVTPRPRAALFRPGTIPGGV
jgi:hypothetical protein